MFDIIAMDIFNLYTLGVAITVTYAIAARTPYRPFSAASRICRVLFVASRVIVKWGLETITELLWCQSKTIIILGVPHVF